VTVGRWATTGRLHGNADRARETAAQAKWGEGVAIAGRRGVCGLRLAADRCISHRTTRHRKKARARGAAEARRMTAIGGGATASWGSWDKRRNAVPVGCGNSDVAC